MSNEFTPTLFTPLSTAALEEMSGARAFIADVAKNLVAGSELTQSDRDLPVLQALASHEAMKHANYEAWVALGIAFGDALAAYVPGLVWRLVTDQRSTYAALQFEGKALSVAAPTMLWKRVERGEDIDLVYIASELKTLIEERAIEAKDV
jgi:hypothetical protein